jgi:hypothetical protein
MPTGEFRNNIIALAETNPEEAIKHFMACVLSDCYPTLADLHKAKSTGISNRMSPPQEVEITIASTEGKLSNNSTIKKSDFKPIATRSNLMVYTLEGPMPINGKPAKHTMSLDKEKGKGKGKTEGGVEFSRDRYIYAKRIEQDYILYKADEGREKLTRNPYADAVSSLISFLKANKDENEKYKEAYSIVCCTLDHNPVTSFYLLFEPYNTNVDTRIINDNTFTEFVKGSVNIKSKESFEDCFENNSDIQGTYLQEVNSVREGIFASGNIAAPASYITVNYEKLCKDGKINNTEVLCANSIKYYTDHKYKRQAQDEFRLHVNNTQLFYVDSVFNLKEYNEFVNDCYRKFNFINCETQVTFNNTKMLKSIKPMEIYFSGPHLFVRSSHFLYVPWCNDSIKAMSNSIESNDDPTSTTIINFAGLNKKYLDNQITGLDNNNEEIESCVAKIMNWVKLEGDKSLITSLSNILSKTD